MKKILLGLTLVGTLLFSETIISDTQAGTETSGGVSNDNFGVSIGSDVKTKLKTPLTNLFETTQWDLFLREFEINIKKIGVCCKDGDPLSCAVGLKAKMIEPIGYFESTKMPLKFPFAGLDLGTKTDMAKGNSFWNIFEDGGAARNVNYNVHMISLPILGTIFKKTMTTFCFDKGSLSLPYISEFDPTWKKDYYFAKMIPHLINSFSPQGLLSTIFDCIASEIANSITMGVEGLTKTMSRESLTTFESYKQNVSNTDNLDNVSNFTTDEESVTLEKVNLIRNTLYYADGCSGFSTIGGYVDGEDPILDATSTFNTVMNSMHGVSAMSPIGFFKKQTEIGLVTSELPRSLNIDSIPDTMCRPKKFAMGIPSQYVLQLAYPTVGSARELGSSAITVSTAKNVPAAEGTVYVVWKRRDYYAWAYFCPAGETGDTK